LPAHKKYFASLETSAIIVSYPVMEHFYTLQGEGFHTGRAAYFIRLAGCDVGCVWCDVKESWDATQHPQLPLTDIMAASETHSGRIAVITGGEPTLHDLAPLTAALKEAGFQTHIETSGTQPITGNPDWITLSPKKFKAPLAENHQIAHELKVVIYHPSDIAWAEQHAKAVSEHCLLYLQPEWSKRETITPLIIDYIQKQPRWRLSLQTHKYINIP
jgi:7-carboxy-7-deazaguanine synthase